MKTLMAGKNGKMASNKNVDPLELAKMCAVCEGGYAKLGIKIAYRLNEDPNLNGMVEAMAENGIIKMDLTGLDKNQLFKIALDNKVLCPCPNCWDYLTHVRAAKVCKEAKGYLLCEN